METVTPKRNWEKNAVGRHKAFKIHKFASLKLAVIKRIFFLTKSSQLRHVNCRRKENKNLRMNT